MEHPSERLKRDILNLLDTLKNAAITPDAALSAQLEAQLKKLNHPASQQACTNIFKINKLVLNGHVEIR